MSVATYKAGQIPLDFIQQTVTNAKAVRLTSLPSKAIRAVIGVEDNAVRYRMDSTLPTTTVGLEVKADNTIEVEGTYALKAIRFIAVGSDALINIQYYGEQGTAANAVVSSPSSSPSTSPSSSPSSTPSSTPSSSPSNTPSSSVSNSPSEGTPSNSPSGTPSGTPSSSPSDGTPSSSPSGSPSSSPSNSASGSPSNTPSGSPSNTPSSSASSSPSSSVSAS